ncbi:flagellar protein FlbT [Litorimonas taeanensis]|uniref:Flagellar protein FlbT n=1 Tax=Litorimonas taeanensis TaxID=568099 RepID=A0A420WMM1_9PROT|nr:flagellar biosynthesis repressor FlbT [Litorimonas taeanensis]RKQ72146.1 flagellar protein FlbT [Litorimonas taeanensis]
MSGLVISLKPNEKFLVNGALLVNGDKRSQICIPNDDTHVLRMSDALHPNDVNTPVKRVYYAVQMILSSDCKAEEMDKDVKAGLDALKAVFEGTPMQIPLEKAMLAFLKGRYYSVLYTLKSLLTIEEELLNRHRKNDPVTLTPKANSPQTNSPQTNSMTRELETARSA